MGGLLKGEICSKRSDFRSKGVSEEKLTKNFTSPICSENVFAM